MANLSKTTRDHDEIRRWAEDRGAHPACVKGTGGSEDVGLLRLDFPGYSGEDSLQEISWDEFFDKFDERGLALLYQEETAEGEKSNFNKIVSSETAEEANQPSHGHRHRASSSGAKKATKNATKQASAKKTASVTKKTVAAKKAAPKKAAAKKAAPKKAAAKNVAQKKAAPKKAAPKKAVGKKAAPKKAVKKASAPAKKAVKKAPAKKAVKKTTGRRR